MSPRLKNAELAIILDAGSVYEGGDDKVWPEGYDALCTTCSGCLPAWACWESKKARVEMGRMYVYRCDSCGEERHLMPGAGMMFPSVCQEVMEGIAAGEYGPELKEAYEASPLPGVCAEKALYVCRACGRWALMPDATLYEPLDVEEALDEQYGEKTVREWGHIPYLMTYQLKKHRVICSFRPICECGSKMRKARFNEGTTLACPSCGTPNGVVELAGFWD